MDDLVAARLEDVSHFFATYYTPDNATLSIAGDFDPAEARTLVERFFGPIPRGRGRPPLPNMELPPVFGEWRRSTIPDAVMLPRLFLAFRIPAFGTPEHDAASVCSAVLGLKKGSRLHRSLVREHQIAAEANAFTFDLAKGSDLLVVDVTARPDVSPGVLEEHVACEVDELRDAGIAQDELDRAIALIETEMVTSMQSAGERADKLSLFATYFGDPARVNDQLERYQAVTREEVEKFAAAYLGEDNRASLMFVPRAPVTSPTETAAFAASST
jgi:predicted Zn-dependent peptidase